MGLIRIAWRIPGLFLTISWHLGLLAVARVVRRVKGEPGLERELRVIRRCAKAVCWLYGMKVSWKGPRPEGRFLLVLNHLSYVDIVAVMSVVDLRFLSKAEIARWPLVGPMTRFVGTLFVDRTKRSDLPRVICEIESTLDRGCGVAFFPEGTSSPGAQVLPFKPSIFEVAANGAMELSCATLCYRTEPPERPAEWSVCWWGNMRFVPHFLRLLAMRSFEANLVFAEERVSHDDRKVLAQKAREVVVRHFTPVCSEDPSLESEQVCVGSSGR